MRLRQIAWTLFPALLGSALPSPADATRWIAYTEADGLPSVDVRDLVQARDGRVWAATSTGLARIDRRIPSARWDPISSEHFEVLAVDASGAIWAGDNEGRLQWFDENGVALQTPVQLPVETRVHALHASADGTVWIGEADSLRRWHPQAGVQAWPVLRGPVVDIDQAPAGRLWLALGMCEPPRRSGGLGYFSRDSIVTLECPPVGFATALLALTDDEVVVGSSLGTAYHYSLAGGFSAEVFGDGQMQTVEDIARDAFGRLWFARKEAYRFDTGGAPSDASGWTRTVFGANEGLSGDRLRVVFESTPFAGAAMTPIGAREVWFGGDIGVAVLTGFPWTTYNTTNGALVCTPLVAEGNCNRIGHIVIDGTRDAIWFGARFGLNRLNDDGSWDAWTSGSLSGTPAGLLGNAVNALHLDADGRIWVSSGAFAAPRGLQFQDFGAATWDTVGLDAERWRVADLSRDAQGFLWIAAEDGVWRLDTTTEPFGETHFSANDGVPPGQLQALTTVDNDVFVASAGGIGRFEHGSSKWTPWPATALPDSGTWNFRDLHVQGDSLYVATDRGLVVVSRWAGSLAEATVLTADSGIPGVFSTDLFDVEDGGAGTLLVAANDGLYRVAAGLARAGRMDARDGLPDVNVLTVVRRDDEVWIGTQGDGAAGHVFEPPETVIVDAPGPVVISSTNPVVVRVDGNDVDSPLELLQFELRIDDGPWSAPQGGSFLSFVPAEHGLADSTHVLFVRAVDNGLLFDATPASAEFELDTTPPVAQITAPVARQAVRGIVEIVGTADDIDDGRFESYFVGVRRNGVTAAPLQIIQPRTHQPVPDGVIATWNTDTDSFPDDWYTLDAVVRDSLGVNGTLRLELLVDNEAPFADVTSPLLVRGDRGATVHSVAGEASIVFPPFAFDGEHTITLDVGPDPEADAGRRFSIAPAGLTLRKNPTLELEAEEPVPGLALHRLEGSEWMYVGGTPAQRAGKTFYAASIDRLGVYALRTAAGSSTGGAVIAQVRAEPRHLRPHTGDLDRIAVSFVLGRPARVTAMVYSRAGRPRRVLEEGRELGSGEQVLYWDGRDDRGSLVASALYIVCIEAGGERVTKVVTVGAD